MCQIAVETIVISMIVLLLVWANDGAGTKSRRFKPFIHIVYKGEVKMVLPLFLVVLGMKITIRPC